jgi:hypothetical protein
LASNDDERAAKNFRKERFTVMFEQQKHGQFLPGKVVGNNRLMEEIGRQKCPGKNFV